MQPSLLLLLSLLLLSAAGRATATVAEEVSLALGELRRKPPPPQYFCGRAAGRLTIDGSLDEPAWAAAPFSAPFVDIVGPTGPAPWFATRVKMLHDDEGLYIAAELEEPRAFALQTLHDRRRARGGRGPWLSTPAGARQRLPADLPPDCSACVRTPCDLPVPRCSIIFHDNDFEVFIDPDGDNELYMEIEVNANGQVWDLLLPRAYRAGGPPVNNWETLRPAVPTQATGPTGWSPMRAAVKVQGSLNARSGSEGWTVELALPWSLLKQAVPHRSVPPASGEQWRINFSRVQYNVSWSEEQGRYVKVPAEQPGYNWVWSPQWQVAMHQPETWGYVTFVDAPPPQQQPAAAAGAAAAAKSASCGTQAPPSLPDVTWPARALLMDVYFYQTRCWQERGRFCTSLQQLREFGLTDVEPALAAATTIEATSLSFVARTAVPLPGGGAAAVNIAVDQSGRLVQFLDGAFDPMSGAGQRLPPPQQQQQQQQAAAS